MAVMVPREKWSDERLDDLSKKVDGGFARLDKKIDDGFARVDSDIRELRNEIKSLQLTMYGSTVAIVIALVGGNAFF